ncbi:hypothetical protein BXT86_01260 [candidate division WOR-3 bacterium 4484_100]|uniref:Outer membrane protein beta-barrel domain-containing protein n=1 Tax=candidate division WOR-3 bacterium 4484_100 TaxID=1936077 RepID=A0A1V4QGH0_UNCW3|nr:MAG: hypothetical protein BXT86_01260 [candidate division WOR-3 bacterium 4484_100]
MKKLLALMIIAGLSGLYAGSIGLGIAYDDFMHSDSTVSAYPSIRADIMTNILPILGLRTGLVNVDIKEDEAGGTMFSLGTGVFCDLCLFIPMASSITPYIPLGVWYFNKYQGFDMSHLAFKGGLGGMMAFGGINGYLELGVNFTSVTPEGGESSSDHWFYGQLGVRVPVGM